MKIIITDSTPELELYTVKGTKYISLEKIVCIEAYNKGSRIYLSNNEIVLTNYLLNLYLEFLPLPFFCRCHYKYIVNNRFVDCFTCTQVILKDNRRISLSRWRKKHFTETLIAFNQLQ